MSYIEVGGYNTAEHGWQMPVGGRSVGYPARRVVRIDDVPYRDGSIDVTGSARTERELSYVLVRHFGDYKTRESAVDELLAALDVVRGEVKDGMSGKTYTGATCSSAEVTDDGAWGLAKVTVKYRADAYAKGGAL